MNRIILVVLVTLLFSSAHAEQIVNGYFRSWGIYGPDYQIMDVPAQYLTHITYNELKFDGIGNVRFTDTWADRDFVDLSVVAEEAVAGNIAQLAVLKNKYPHLVTMVSVGGLYADNFSKIMSDEAVQQKLIKNIGKFLKFYQLDGIEINWPKPMGNEGIESKLTGDDYNRFIKHLSQHLKELSKQQNKRYWLSLTLPFYPVKRSVWDPALVKEFVDYYTVNSYLLHGSWNDSAYLQSPLYVNPRNANTEQVAIEQSIRYYLVNSIPSEKLLFNLAPIATGWQFNKDQFPDLYEPIEGMVKGTWDAKDSAHSGVVRMQTVQTLIKENNWEVQWDDVAKAGWVIDDENFRLYSIENEQSIAEKLAYVDSLDLAGVSIADMHNDARDETGLLAVIYQKQASFEQRWLNFQYWVNEHFYWVYILVFAFVVVITLWGGMVFFRKKEDKDTIEQDELDQLQEELGRLRMASLMAAQYLNKLINQPKLSQKSRQTMAETREKVVEQAMIGAQLLDQGSYSSAVSQLTDTDLEAFLKAWLIAEELEADIEIVNNVHVQLDTELFYQLLSTWSKSLAGINGIQNIQISSLITGRSIQLMLQSVGGQFDISSMSTAQQLRSLARQQNIELHFSQHQEYFQLVMQLPLSDEFSMEASGAEKVVFLEADHFAHSLDIITDEAIDTESKTSLVSMSDLANIQRKMIDCQSGKEIVDLLTEFVNDKEGWRVDVQEQGLDQPCEGEGQYLFKSSGLDGYQLLIQTDECFEEEEIQLFKVLQLQLDRVQQHLLNLTKQPQVLADLYEIAANKDQLMFIKADHGYATLSFSGRKADKVISLRLRAIMQFFDDHNLIQIHRSWLVNPNKVEYLEKIAKNKYELTILGKGKEQHRIPVARNHLPLLQRKYPHWFE